MNNSVQHLWTPLATTPLLWLVVTLAAYVVGRVIQQACKGAALACPVLIAIVLVVVVVLATRTSYKSYFAGAQFSNFLLGPATIALAIPLARNARLVRENLHSIGLAGSGTSIVSGVGIVWYWEARARLRSRWRQKP
jgi:putative effector of murein hydrolase